MALCAYKYHGFLTDQGFENECLVIALAQFPGEEGQSLVWKPVFLALTDKDLMLFDTVPSSKEEWATPFQDLQLLATR